VVGGATEACGAEALTGGTFDADGDEVGDCAAHDTRRSERKSGSRAIVTRPAPSRTRSPFSFLVPSCSAHELSSLLPRLCVL
jgi:hypothetical protein